MIPTVIYVLGAIRRALKKTGRGLNMVAEVFHESMDDWRAAKRKYPFAE
jgi:hypothetical protein